MVSKLCVACKGFGKAELMYDWAFDEKQSEEIISHVLDLGINFFDTANQYSSGTSEEYLGKASELLYNKLPGFLLQPLLLG